METGRAKDAKETKAGKALTRIARIFTDAFNLCQSVKFASTFSSQTSRPSRDNLLIGSYLSFYDKKGLTNGIDWFILCAMNANEISPKSNARLKRIKIVSRIAKYVFLAFFMFMIGLDVFFFHMLRRMMEATGKLAPFFIVPQIILLVWYWKLSRLFSFYERGMVFSLQTTRCIRFLGILCILGWLMNFVACSLFSWPSSSPELNSIYIFQISKNTVTGVSTHTFHTGFFSFDFGTGIDFGTLAAGMAIVLIAFIMDEGRKIQEEQELTV